MRNASQNICISIKDEAITMIPGSTIRDPSPVLFKGMPPSINIRYLEDIPTSLSRINERAEIGNESPLRNYMRSKLNSSSALHDHLKNA